MRTRSIHAQLGLTLVLAVAVVLGVHSWVVIASPPPAAQMQSLQSTVLALGDPLQASRFGLKSEWMDEVPSEMESNLISNTIAEILRVPRERVRMRWMSEKNSFSILRAGERNTEAETQLPRVLMLVPALPPFSAALKESNGERWHVLSPVQPWLTPWQKQLVASFMFSALLLLPFAWWAASRLSKPLRKLAQAAQKVELSSDSEQIPIEGPLEAQQLAHALRAAMQRWRQQSAERIQLIAAIAHDLRTPITGLRLRLDPLPDEEREPLLADLARIEQMVTRALEYVRSDQDALQLEPVDLTVLAQDGVNSARAAGLPAIWSGSDEVTITLQADALSLHRALANLIENAARHAGGGEVSVRQEGYYACVEVSDRGPGIASERFEQLMQPFQRGDRARTARGGFGLGLSIAATIARRHQGELRLSARPGGGLLAVLRLPIHSSLVAQDMENTGSDAA